MENDVTICPFCKKPAAKTSADTQTVGVKGFSNIAEIAHALSDNETVVIEGDIVHKKCFRDYTRKKTIDKKLSLASQKSNCRKRAWCLEKKTYDPEKDCLFCGKFCDVKHSDIHKVKTLTFEERIKNIIKQNQNEWTSEVLERLNANPECSSVMVYHRECTRSQTST